MSPMSEEPSSPTSLLSSPRDKSKRRLTPTRKAAQVALTTATELQELGIKVCSDDEKARIQEYLGDVKLDASNSVLSMSLAELDQERSSPSIVTNNRIK